MKRDKLIRGIKYKTIIEKAIELYNIQNPPRDDFEEYFEHEYQEHNALEDALLFFEVDNFDDFDELLEILCKEMG